MKTAVCAVCVLIAFAAVLPQATAAEPANRPAAADANTFTRADLGFSITGPANWRQTTKGFLVTVNFVEAAPEDPNRTAGQIQVLATSLPLEMSLSDWAEATVAGMKRGDMKIVSSKEVELSGIPALRIVAKPKGSKTGLHALAYVCVSDCRVFQILCFCDTNRFAQYEAVFDSAFRSMRIYEPDPNAPRTAWVEEHGFRITGPAGWEMLKNAGMTTKVFFKEPVSDEKDRYPGIMFVGVDRLLADEDLSEFADSGLDTIRKGMKDFKAISTKTVDLGGTKARRVVLQHTNKGQPLQQICYFLVNHQRGYAIVSTMTPDRFDEYEPIFEKACNTLVLFKPDPPEPQVYASEKYGFRITGPSGWVQEEDKAPNLLTYKEPLTGPSDSYHEMISIWIEPVRPGADLAAFTDTVVKDMAGSTKLLFRKKTRLGERAAVRLVWQPKNMTPKLKSFMYVVVDNGYGYTVHCIAEADEFDEYEPLFERACKTFETFKPPRPQKAEAKPRAKGKDEVSPEEL